MRDDRANADHLLDALMEATAKLRKIADLCQEERAWNLDDANPEVLFFANDIRNVLRGVE